MRVAARAIAPVLLVVAAASGASAQDPLRVGVVGRAQVGHRAPDLVLPYYTRSGAGPVDQPFRLVAELGRAVVIVFGPEAEWGWWSGVDRAADSAWAKAVVVGVVRSEPSVVAGGAAGLTGEHLKILPDPKGVAGRRYGVERADRIAVVVADDGRVLMIRSNFDPTNSDQISAIGVAVTAALPRP